MGYEISLTAAAAAAAAAAGDDAAPLLTQNVGLGPES